MNYEDLTGEAKLRYDLAIYIYEGHKDAYGVKGRHYRLWSGNGYEVSAEWSTDELRAEADRISDAVGEAIAEDRRREEAAIAAFEAAVAKCIEIGAGDRDTAIRWVKSSYEDDGYGHWYGDEHLEYEMGVPFGFFASLEAAA